MEQPELTTVQHVILRHLRRDGISIPKLHEEVRQDYGKISVRSVYKSVRQLEDSGLLSRDKGVVYPTVTYDWATGEVSFIDKR